MSRSKETRSTCFDWRNPKANEVDTRKMGVSEGPHGKEMGFDREPSKYPYLLYEKGYKCNNIQYIATLITIKIQVLTESIFRRNTFFSKRIDAT